MVVSLYGFRSGSEHMYGFSEFTCSLNEPEPSVCPTDSRLRPDQRVMENGDFDNANVEKVCSKHLEYLCTHHYVGFCKLGHIFCL